MYTHTDFPSKKALKDAIADGRRPTYYQPGPFGGDEPLNGIITLEGPHYPKPHRWYARARVEEGYIVEVLR